MMHKIIIEALDHNMFRIKMPQCEERSRAIYSGDFLQLEIPTTLKEFTSAGKIKATDEHLRFEDAFNQLAKDAENRQQMWDKVREKEMALGNMTLKEHFKIWCNNR